MKRMQSPLSVFQPLRVRALSLVVLALLLLGVAGAMALTPRVRIADTRTVSLEDMIPRSFGAWTEYESRRFIMPDPEADRLVNEIYNSVLTRAYQNEDGEIVMLVIAYGGDQSDALQLHRPEVCYVANGFRVDAPVRVTERIAGHDIKFSRIGTRDAYAFEPVSYWMRVGERQVTTTMDRQRAKLASGLKGIIPDGVLVRMSSRTGRDAEAEYALHDAFVADLLTALDAPAQEFLLGGSPAEQPI